MKRNLAIQSCVLLITLSLAALLCACKHKPTNDIDFTTQNMPVISINTKNNDKDALDFAAKPVASFVAEMIASWTPDYVMPPAPYYEDCQITLTDATGTITGADLEAQVKVRGNWTTTYDKKPLRIKFNEKQSLFGLNDNAAMKNWVLLAEYKDASMLRNKTALSLASEILAQDNLYTSDTCFVEVEINGEYWGVYLLAEQQQTDNNRIDITEVEKDYTGTDIGYFLEFDGYNYTNENPLESFYVDYANFAPLVPFYGQDPNDNTSTDLEFVTGFTIKSDIYSQKQHDFIASYMNNVYRIMYAAAYEDKAYVFNSDYTEIYVSDTLSPREAVENVVDINSLADMYIISELTCDADISWSSFFMDVDFGPDGNKKLTFEAPWDFDSALGNRDYCTDGTGFHAANAIWDANNNHYTINPWLTVLMHEDWFQDIIRDKWTAVYDNGVFDRAYEMIEQDTMHYADAFSRNYTKWNNIKDRSAFEHELSPQSAQCMTHAEASDNLLKWLKSRVEFLNEYWYKN